MRAAEGVTQASIDMGLLVALAPRYNWAEGVMTPQLKYSVVKLDASARYKKPTKAQRQRGHARRGLEAAQGVPPLTRVSFGL